MDSEDEEEDRDEHRDEEKDESSDAAAVLCADEDGTDADFPAASM